MQLFPIEDAINEYLDNCKTHSVELKNININSYKLMIKRDEQLDTYTSNKNRINIVFSELDNHSDECFVNAANELLEGGGGIDEYVHQLGGNELLDEIKKIPLNQFGCRLLEGEAILTQGYNNKYKKFIHTVAPYYDEFGCMKHNIMNKCFDSIFALVSNYEIESITIPAIGTGFYGFHMLDFTIICLRKVIQYLDKNPKLKKVTLITNSKLQYNFYSVMFNDYIYNI
jgi:O-acetyl-ADP-ribose deacetylase (regulator of RNase III)